MGQIRSRNDKSLLSLENLPINRGIAFGVIIITALIAFEIFNYSTTDFALSDLLGDLNFVGIRWATILSIAFCGIDFAGIARLFTPEGGAKGHSETWYLFGAWLLAATMNAMLTWWGVSIAVLNHETLGNSVIDRATLLRSVPIFVALLVWLIRVLIIGTFSAAGNHLFETDTRQAQLSSRTRTQPGFTPSPIDRSSKRILPRAAAPTRNIPSPINSSNAPASRSFKPAPKPASSSDQDYPVFEPGYQKAAVNAAPSYSLQQTSNSKHEVDIAGSRNKPGQRF